MGRIVASTLRAFLYPVLAALFIYKAFEEASLDPVWALIYLLVGVEYFVEGGQASRLRESGGREAA